MNTVKVRNLIIGEGRPKICVPIVGRTREEIIEQANAFGQIGADMAEWRADWFEDVFDLDRTEEVLSELRLILKDIPLLFTFRTAKEGGEKAIEPEIYVKLNRRAANTGCVDLIDVELFAGESVVADIIEAARANNVKVIMSNHDFEKTPPKVEIISRLCEMQKLGADITKIAVMPETAKDVLTLLEATEEMYRIYADRPVITMSMGGQGVLSRLGGEIFGSAVTFGAAGKASAPGQLEVGELNKILSLIHKGLS